MRKFKSPLPAGGAPLFNTEANGVLNREIWEALEQLGASLISPIGAMIITGGIISDNGDNTFDITKGIALVSGEFMEFDASTNNPFPSYLGASVETIEQATYADAVDRDYISEKRAELYTSTPSGTYVVIAGAGNLGVNFNTFLARQWDLNAVIDARTNEAASRPQFIGEVDAAGVLTVKYSSGGSWTVTKTGTGIYQVRKDALVVNKPLLITPRTTGISAVYVSSYDFNVGHINTGVLGGSFSDIGFTFVVYP